MPEKIKKWNCKGCDRVLILKGRKLAAVLKEAKLTGGSIKYCPWCGVEYEVR